MGMMMNFICNRLLLAAGPASALGWLLLSGSAARAALVDVDIVAATNAYLLRSGATTDQNEAETLQSKRLNDTNTRVSYLRFNLPTDLNADDIVAATLRLKYVNNSVLTTATSDTVRVYGLNDLAANGTTDESNWTGGLTFNTQPAGVLANASTALPTANTTNLLGSSLFAISNANPPTPTPAIVDIPLDLTIFQSMVTNDTNDQVTFLFHNLANTIISWASITNTAGHEQPTLMLDVNAVPEPASAGLCLTAVTLALGRNRRRS